MEEADGPLEDDQVEEDADRRHDHQPGEDGNPDRRLLLGLPRPDDEGGKQHELAVGEVEGPGRPEREHDSQGDQSVSASEVATAEHGDDQAVHYSASFLSSGFFAPALFASSAWLPPTIATRKRAESRTSAGVPCINTSPAWSASTWVALARTRSMWWSTVRIPTRFSCRRASRIARSAWRSASSRPDDGSSSSKSRGPEIIARAMSTSLRAPKESEPASFCAWSARPTKPRSVSARCLM